MSLEEQRKTSHVKISADTKLTLPFMQQQGIVLRPTKRVKETLHFVRITDNLSHLFQVLTMKYTLIGAEQLEHATPILSLCHGIFTD